MREGAGSGSAELLHEGVDNSFEHGVEVLVDLGIREPDDAAVRVLLEPAGPFVVVIDAVRMGIAVDLDDELCCGTIEVQNEWTERMLSAEVERQEVVATKVLPESLFGGCEGLTQLARAGLDRRGCPPAPTIGPPP